MKSNPQPIKILIAGMAGLPGYFAYHHFSRQSHTRVWGLLPRHYPQTEDPGMIHWNAEEKEQLSEVFNKIKPDWVIDASGNCALKVCELHPDLAHLINVETGEQLARLSAQRGCGLIRLSSDLVFSGLDKSRAKIKRPDYPSGIHGGYRETDPVSPLTVYGKNMVEAEECITNICPKVCILRISLPMGPSLNGHAGAIDWIESRFKKNRPATLYFDEVRTPFYMADLTNTLECIMEQGLSGLFHFGGARNWSLYEIAQIIHASGKYPVDLLMGCSRFEAGPIPPRAGNVTMDSSKIRARLGGRAPKPWPMESQFWPTHINWHREEGLNLDFEVEKKSWFILPGA